MKKKFREFLCLLFAVVLPFSFVACGDKKAPNNDSGTSIETPNNNPTPTPENPGTEEVSYVLDEEEVVKVLQSTSTFLENFVDDLNDKYTVLEDNNYLTTVGDLTCGALNYLNYPSMLITGISSQLESKSKDFELGQIYAYIPAGGIFRYFEIDVVDNTEINITVVSKDTAEYVYFNFKFLIDNGNINAIKLSRLETPSAAKKIKFMDVLFDVKNSNFDACFGNLVNYSSSSDKFFADNFTKEKFDLILDSCWGYTCYEKLPIGANNDFECSYEQLDNVLVGKFDSFDFLDAFTKYNECVNLTNDKLVGLNADIVQLIESEINTFSYVPEEFRFEKNA